MSSYSRCSITVCVCSLGLLSFPLLGWGQVISEPVAVTAPGQFLPLTPRLTGIGFTGDEGMVWGDGMLPVLGNSNRIWYVDIQGKTAFDSDWMGSLGTGIRGIVNDSTILGAYVFVDRSQSPNDNSFWFVSPGLEELGEWVDFRANGYFPTSNKQQYIRTDWADNFGINNFVVFTGHEQFDILMNEEETVSWGADAEVGAKIPGLSGTRAYVGGYHFNGENATDINGVSGRVEVPINRYLGVTARNSYDNVQHNTFLVGLRLTLGGVNVHPRDQQQAIQERILDPIERNMATLGQGTGEPIQDVFTPVSQASQVSQLLLKERDNIWFFSPTGTDTFEGNLTDCTSTNVCVNTNFNQTTIDGINALKASSPQINNVLSTSPTFFLAPGNYNSFTGMSPLVFTNDWVFGRSANFLTPQLSAVLSGGMLFNGNNNRVDHIILQSDGIQDVGIALTPGSNLLITTSNIGSLIPGLNYHTAIQLVDATLRVYSNSNIVAFGNDNQPVTGIAANYTSNLANYVLAINNSSLSAVGLSTTATNQSITGLSVINGPQVVLTNAKINVLAEVMNDLAASEINMATGLFATGSNVTISGNSPADSYIQVEARVEGDNSGFNLAAGIGNNSVNGVAPPFQNNVFKINNTTISSITSVTGTDMFDNFAVGIGENAVNNVGSIIFSGNSFVISNSAISSNANITHILDFAVNNSIGIGGGGAGKF